jgi:hypothetical protein
MGPFSPKSKMRHIAHNPTGELIHILTKEVKKCNLLKRKNNEINSRTNSK